MYSKFGSMPMVAEKVRGGKNEDTCSEKLLHCCKFYSNVISHLKLFSAISFPPKACQGMPFCKCKCAKPPADGATLWAPDSSENC